jgi:Pvc16 N-terminal domain
VWTEVSVLDVTVDFLVRTVNAWHASRNGPLQEMGRLVVSRLVDETGKWAVPANRIGVCLINVEEDRILKSQLPEPIYVNGRHVMQPPPLKLNLHLMFAANFAFHDQALKWLSQVLTFFQAHPLFTQDEHPTLDPLIARLSVELQSPGYDQLNQIWAFLGGKFLPSVLYKVRMVPLQDREPLGIAAPVTTIAIESHRQ